MSNFIVYLVLSFLGMFISTAQNSVEVAMYNFDSNQGTVQVGLYISEGHFLEIPTKTLETTIKDQKAQVVFEDLPDGVYAIGVFHDEDDDKEMDMLLGFFPMEDYGTSNNAPARFGPPEWEDAQFALKGGQQLVQNISL